MSLTIYRRHGRREDGKPCPHRANPYWKRCACPMWIRGTLAGVAVKESLGTRSWEKAEEELKRRLDAENPRQAREAISLTEAVEVFLADIKARAWAEPTRKKFDVLLLQRLLPWAASRGLQVLTDLTLDEVTRFRASWKDSPLTAQKNLERLRMFFRFCVEREWLKKNPAEGLKVKVTTEPKDPFTPEEFRRILDACDRLTINGRATGGDNAEETRAMILLLRHSGLRISDASQLRKTDLVPASDGRGHGVVIHQQKSHRAVYVPLHPTAVAALQAWAPKRPGPYFFWSGRGAVDTLQTNWRKRLERVFIIAEKDAPFEHHPHPHRFRHTFAAEYLLAGVPMEIVSLLLGHSSVKITERHYAKFTRARQEQLEGYVRGTWETGAGAA